MGKTYTFLKSLSNVTNGPAGLGRDVLNEIFISYHLR